jgi:methyl-accepting chemotaxis protein
VADIANGAREQATALQGINGAVNQMDQGTQQNAVVVGNEAGSTRSGEIEMLASQSRQQSWCVASIVATIHGALATA